MKKRDHSSNKRIHTMVQAGGHEVIDLLRALVRIPSLSHQEGPAADLVAEYVSRAGLAVERLDDNVYFALGAGEDRLLLNSHLDVVPPSEGHPHGAFEAALVDGRLYGRGAVDAKASGAAMTVALLELAREGWVPPGGQVLVALTTCEESGKGYNGLEALRPHLPPLRAALVGEPTALQPCIAQKGLLILKAHARGRSAHAARAHLGVNAILAAAADLRRLDGFTLDRLHPVLGASTFTVTMIEGGEARNMVPEHCTFWLDVRTTPAYTHEELTALFAGVLDASVEVHSRRLIPVDTPADARIVKACLRALPGTEPFGSATMSDWLFLPDLPVVKIGPGDSRLSHTADEHIEAEEVVRAVASYKKIIQAYFQHAA